MEEKLKQLEEALKQEGNSPEDIATFKKAIAKLEAEIKSKKLDAEPKKEKPAKKKIERPDKVSDKTKKLKKEASEKGEKKEQRSKAEIEADYHAEVEKVEKKPNFMDLTEAEVIAAGLAINKQRSFYSQIMDNGSDNKRRLSPTPENLLRWMKEPGKYDLIGVDTFSRHDPTADYKRIISKQKIFNLMGIKV